MQPISERSRRAQNALTRAAAPFRGWACTSIIENEGHIRGARILLRLESPDGGDSVIVKIFDQPGMAATRFEMLRDLNGRTETVVRARMHLADHNLFVMDDLGPRTLFDQMRKVGSPIVIGKCARWLGRYAGDTDLGVLPFDIRPISMEIDAQFDALADAEAAETARTILTGAIGTFDGRDMPHHASFGDLKPPNICIDPKRKRMIAVDPVPMGPWPLERELAYLLHWSRWRRWQRFMLLGQPVNESRDREDRQAALTVLGGRLDESLLDGLLRVNDLWLWARLQRKRRDPVLIAALGERLGMPHAG